MDINGDSANPKTFFSDFFPSKHVLQLGKWKQYNKGLNNPKSIYKLPQDAKSTTGDLTTKKCGIKRT